MIDLNLINYMKEELNRTPTQFHRYMYNKIIWEDRMIGIVGPRGVGKSTMVKQYILNQNNQEEWLYVSADNAYFFNNTLIGLVDEWEKENGKHIIIDEIHKYNGWSQELKQIYDTHPAMQVIFTGSSVLDIHKGAYDLSRRALIFSMQGMSFREFLCLEKGIEFPVYTLRDVINHTVSSPIDFHPLPYFREYLNRGYYPFSSQPGYEIRLQQVLNQTLEVDIPQYANMNIATSRKLARMLSIISGLAPYKPNMLRLSVELNVSRKDLPNYLVYLEKAGLIDQLREDTIGLRELGKVEKIYVDNPNLMYALQGGETNIGNVRETFFFNQTRVSNKVRASKKTDFKIGEYIFEVGGAKKGQKQLENDPNGIVVRDDIEEGFGNIVPLWQFGLLY